MHAQVMIAHVSKRETARRLAAHADGVSSDYPRTPSDSGVPVLSQILRGHRLHDVGGYPTRLADWQHQTSNSSAYAI